MRISILVGPGATDSGLSIALDVLRAANAIHQRSARSAARRPPFEVSVVSSDGRPVTLASGLRVGGLVAARHAARADVWMVPGTWAETEADVERWLRGPAFAAQARVVERAAARGARLYGSCTGAYVVASTGVLDEHEATTSWWLTGPFLRAFPRVTLDVRRALIAHRHAATAGAVLAQADLALHLVRTTLGPSIASQVTRYLLLDEHAAQAPYMAVSQLRADDPLLHRAESYLRRHLDQVSGVPELARAIGTSPRTLARRTQLALGVSPGRWLRRLRVEAAAHRLETTHTPVEEVAEQVGLGSAATLRRELRRELGRSPRELRARHTGG